MREAKLFVRQREGLVAQVRIFGEHAPATVAELQALTHDEDPTPQPAIGLAEERLR
ncbi:MAG: hypothetical protein H0U06_12785 [Solirubrobacterales bacterium]|nr:hypothetical protein [Solirubrobacterales bacterium]